MALIVNGFAQGSAAATADGVCGGGAEVAGDLALRGAWDDCSQAPVDRSRRGDPNVGALWIVHEQSSGPGAAIAGRSAVIMDPLSTDPCVGLQLISPCATSRTPGDFCGVVTGWTGQSSSATSSHAVCDQSAERPQDNESLRETQNAQD